MAPPASPFRRLAVDPLLQLPQWNRNFALDQHVERSAPAPQPPQPAAPASQPALPAGLQPREQGVQLYAPGAKSEEQGTPQMPRARRIVFDSTKSATPAAAPSRPPSTPLDPDSAARQLGERNPKTPLSFRRAPSGQSWRQQLPPSDAPLSAASLRRLPNATDAEYWLRGAEAKHDAGDDKSAAALLRTGIKRGARPTAALHNALEALLMDPSPDVAAGQAETAPLPRQSPPEGPTPARELSFDATPAGDAPEPAAPDSAATPQRRVRQLGSPHRVKTPGTAPRLMRELKALAGGAVPELASTAEAMGRLELLTPVRVKQRPAEELGSSVVLTQVRRSARKPQPGEQLEAMLNQCNYAYAPQAELDGAHPPAEEAGVTQGGKARLARTSEPGVQASSSSSSPPNPGSQPESEAETCRQPARSGGKQPARPARHAEAEAEAPTPSTTPPPTTTANLIRMFDAQNLQTPPPAAITPKAASALRRSARLQLSANRADRQA
eukprot:jgi/Tetstr1/455456/TSEL_042285.t1